ncbi:D-amino-acid oxidase [Plodia interpunctella]|uniref:D-amino-acid oxidase n=1 Tax=Plodia interpunctella TaxID=58824 RepID=UPI002368157D|nr:D-amino-acid oxidase [Plodia interpunctella]
MYKVAVLGGGINGFACAVKIKEKFPEFEVVLISSDFSPNTTGDGSGGLWYPYLCGDTPESLITKWGCETYSFLNKLWLEGDNGVILLPMYYLHRRKETFKLPAWSPLVFGYQELGPAQLSYLSQRYSSDYEAGETFTTFISRPPAIISYLHRRFETLNGKILHAKITSLSDYILKEYDVVVNCTGLGARDIVPDETVYAIRGQIAKVKAPWLCEAIIDKDRGNYILPNSGFCVLGGTNQENDYNTQVDPKDSERIFKGCIDMIPSLKNAQVMSEWVGLRPGRHNVRLEAEERGEKLYIHNYGHGGSGFTLFWGCASDVVDILEQKLKLKLKKSSKL